MFYLFFFWAFIFDHDVFRIRIRSDHLLGWGSVVPRLQSSLLYFCEFDCVFCLNSCKPGKFQCQEGESKGKKKSIQEVIKSGSLEGDKQPFLRWKNLFISGALGCKRRVGGWGKRGECESLPRILVWNEPDAWLLWPWASPDTLEGTWLILKHITWFRGNHYNSVLRCVFLPKEVPPSPSALSHGRWSYPLHLITSSLKKQEKLKSFMYN